MAKLNSRQAAKPPAPVSRSALSDRVRRILANRAPISPDDWFILTQVHLICLFRHTKKDSRKTKLFKYISRREEEYISQKKKEGSEINLTPQDFLNLNQWVVSQDSAGELENLIKRVKERRKLVRRELKKLKK